MEGDKSIGPLVTKICDFCKSSSNDPLLGEKYSTGGFICHYFCLLLSHKVRQAGGDSDGILGFLAPDIRKELARGRKLLCKYCNKVGATIACRTKNCKVSFHLPCGIAKGTTHKFLSDYPTYCHSHRKPQRFPVGLHREKGLTCCVCMIPVNIRKEKKNLIWATCCRRQTVMHRNCVQKYANSAGYALKCPNCCGRMTFIDCLQKNGVFCPLREASWERNGAFSELVCDPLCNMSTCNGFSRSFNRCNSLWEIVTCCRCGAFSTHRACGGIHLLAVEFYCLPCQAAIANDLPPEPTDPSAKPCAVEYCLHPRGRYVFSPGEWDTIPCQHCDMFVAHTKCAGPVAEWYCNRFPKFPDGASDGDDDGNESSDSNGSGPIIQEIEEVEQDDPDDDLLQPPSKRGRLDNNNDETN